MLGSTDSIRVRFAFGERVFDDDAFACYHPNVSAEDGEKVGWRPRWWPLLAIVVVGTVLPSMASEALRAIAPLGLLFLSRGWLGRIPRTLMAVGSAAHGALLLMMLWPTPFVGDADPEEALLSAIFLARVLELPWMLAYAHAGLVLPPELSEDDDD